MTINLAPIALTSIGAYAIGSGLAETRTKPEGQPKGWGMAKVALGVAMVGVGLHLGLNSMLENPNSTLRGWDISTNPALERFHLGSNADGTFDPTKCDLSHLNSLIHKEGDSTFTSKIFTLLDETRGVTCDNYLPWQDIFMGPTGYIDSIKPGDLDQLVQWGVDKWQRPFIAVKQICNEEAGAIAYFQRYTEIDSSWVTGKDFANLACSKELWSRGRPFEKHAEWLTDLFNMKIKG